MSESSKGVLLVVDDEPLKRLALQVELSEAGYTVIESPDAISAMQLVRTRPVDVVVTDLRMPNVDGLQLLEQIKVYSPSIHVIIMTAYASVDTAVQAMKRGAYDYISKPFDTRVLLEKLDRLRCSPGWRQSRTGDDEKEQVGLLVGQGHAAKQFFKRIRAVADAEYPVLIEAETGCVPDRIASAIHELSARSSGRFISCSTVGANSLQSELFGVAGSDGSPARPGRLEAATGGSLLLDEVDQLPMELQTRLLRMLEQKQLERMGSAERVPVDVRLICATRRDLRELVDAGEFREELYYRLSAGHLLVPPLRDRQEDIPLLVDQFLAKRRQSGNGKPIPASISPHALENLMQYDWPGNILELEHTIEKAITFAGDTIEARDIVLPRQSASIKIEDDKSMAQCPAGLTETVAGVERTLIDAALRRAVGNQAKAAQFLGIPRTTLRDKMAKHGILQEAAPRRTAPYLSPQG